MTADGALNRPKEPIIAFLGMILRENRVFESNSTIGAEFAKV